MSRRWRLARVKRPGILQWRDPWRTFHQRHAWSGQAKYVDCASGAIIDVAVDLRVR
jgi:dTDP-4-dehydrorhamnose 3,5-epimerase-like enzyme